MQTMRVKIASQTIERKDTEVKALKPAGEYKSTNWRVLGVPFGGHVEGRDSDGEAFTSETQIGLKLGDTRPITYYHGFGVEAGEAHQDPPAILGEATYTGEDDRGHWFNIAFDESEPLARRVIEAGADAVKASSGAVSHLVRGTTAGIITNWPVGELALFDTNEWRQPANQFAVVELVSTPETTESEAEAGEALQLVGEGVKSEQEIQTIREPMEGSKMNEEEKLVEETIVEETQKQEAPVKEQSADLSELTAELKALRSEIGEMKRSAPAQIKAKPYAQMSNDEQVHEFVKSLRGHKASIAETHTTTNTDLVNVPRCTYDRIRQKAEELALWPRLGIQKVITERLITGGEFDVFKPTAEAAETDLDRLTPHTEVKFDNVKYTKRVEMTWETLDKTDGDIEDWIVNQVGRAWARTVDQLLWDAISASGTKLADFASATAITAGDLEKVVYSDIIDKYLDNTPSVSLLMRRSTVGALESVYSPGRIYDDQRPFLGERVHAHSSVPVIGAGAKSIWFGNWYEGLGYRELDKLNFIRDPYSRASNGILTLHYYAFGVIKAINPEAFGYGQHPDS